MPAATLCLLLHAASACASPSLQSNRVERVQSLSHLRTRASESKHAALPAWLPAPLNIVWGVSQPSLSDPSVSINTQKVTAAEGYTLHVDALAILTGARTRLWRLERLLEQLNAQPSQGGTSERREVLLRELRERYNDSLDADDGGQLAEWLLIGTQE